MGFGSFISHLAAPAVKVLGPAAYVAIPFLGPTALAASVIDTATAKIGSVVGGVGHTVSTPVVPQPYVNAPQPVHHIQQYPGAYYSQPQPYYQPPPQPQYGGSSWDFSTPSIPYSTPPSPTFQEYSAAPAPAQDRSWEDLILGSALFL